MTFTGERITEQTLFNGARLWQLPELFPRAALREEEGFIRNSTIGDIVYLTSSFEVAKAYGAIPGQEYVRRHREDDVPMAFFPIGVILAIDPNHVSTRELRVDESTAKIPDEELRARIYTAEGPISVSAVQGLGLVFYDTITSDPGVEILDATFQPMNRTAKEMGRAKRALGNATFAIDAAYPQLSIEMMDSGMSPDEAVTIFERT